MMIKHTSFSICGMNQIRIAVLITLKHVWNVARAKESWVGLCSEALGSRPTMPHTIRTNGKNRMSTQMTPNTLKTKCAMAVRRACVFALSAARFAVTVVPMFSPITRAMPWKMEIAPVAHRTIVIAISAAELCTIAVRIVPISRNSRIVP